MAQSPDWFDLWVDRHSSVFGLDADKDLAMLLSWRELFLGAGYTEAELHEATDYLAVNDPPKWRSEHLAAIQERVRNQRREALRKSPAVETSYKDCQMCAGTGWVADLPDLRQVFGGDWQGGATCAVVCDCAYGQQERMRHHKTTPCGMRQYERCNPRWREQIEKRNKMILARIKARGCTEYADKIFGPIMAKLNARKA